jgi:hypothetical protein
LPRSIDFRVLLRVSLGSRRKSSPSNSIRSKAQMTAAALGRCLRMRSNTASTFWSVMFAPLDSSQIIRRRWSLFDGHQGVAYLGQ